MTTTSRKATSKAVKRCSWAGIEDAEYIRYHDEEWGVPKSDDIALFEKLNLEAFQSGLSWLTILKKRENFRNAFDGFDPIKVARYSDRDIARLMADAGIVRNRLKIESAVRNAKAFVAIQKELGSFDGYVWPFVGGRPIQNRRRSMKSVPATTKESDALSKDLKKRGFNFVGSTIIYAYMQAVGMVNDHVTSCFRYDACARLK